MLKFFMRAQANFDSEQKEENLFDGTSGKLFFVPFEEFHFSVTIPYFETA